MFKNFNYLKLNRKINKYTRNKTRFLKKFILSIILILCFISIGFIIILNTYLNKINKTDIDINETFSNQGDTTSSNEENFVQKTSSDITNIALFGIDETEGVAGRSDCIMILTIDNKHKELKLSSLVRDSYVTIPTKNNKDKINHAYVFGGPKLALETINENFKLNISKFITVNFTSLPNIIDDIGGITLNLTSDELEYINSAIYNTNKFNHTNSPNILTAGEHLVDGTQALAYCRIRYTEGGDFKRTERQRTVLNKLLEKSKSIPLTQYPSLLDELLPTIHTNLEKSEILSLAINLNSLRNKPILQDRFPCDEDSSETLINGIYYYVFNKDSTAEKMHEFIFE
ncbi:cell envelope-related transcriptional attenuator [Clostridium sp. DL-VIII]|uniref:LCP family protein n=1 Tax=Clostridium sp. DL-VIII TaxID=641107 RepID=UPI00023AF9C8|nr:LCP family protein [Clostridium sp. DL-VIII]EHI99334.1 cell envelope-related transcriptional attenuator [Clostridium sp. DL-VIII]